MGNTATTFYHYTNTAGKDAILTSKRIRRSDGAAEARYGIGVYGTSLDPSVPIQQLIWNNWDGVVDHNKRVRMKAAWAVKVMIPEEEVEKVNSQRDILLYRDCDLDLTKYEWEVIKV